MKTETREITIPERVIPAYKANKQVFIAFDGREFEDACACQEHERELFRQSLKESGNILICDDLSGCIPFDGGDYNNEYYDYLWFKLVNESGRDELINAYPGLCGGERIPIGKWCILEAEDDGDSYWNLMTDGFRYIEKILKKLKDIDPDIIDKIKRGDDV